MNFECGICTELLYRAKHVTIAVFLKTVLRHARLRELKRILEELGYDDGDSECNFRMIQTRFKQILTMSNQPDWVVPIMFQFMRIICTPCGHTFHFWCLEEWQYYRKSMGYSTCCPYCRQLYTRTKVCAIKLGQLVDTSRPPRPELTQEKLTREINIIKLIRTGVSLEEHLEMFSRKNFNISFAAGGDCNEPRSGLMKLAGLCFKYKSMDGTKETSKGINPQPKQVPRRLHCKCFMENLKGSFKIDLVVPILCFILSIWRIENHVSHKKEIYDVDEENLLVEPCYFDWYFAVWTLVPSWICLILDITFLFLEDLDRDIALMIA